MATLQKVLFVPRAINDALKVLFIAGTPFIQRYSIAKTLLYLKWLLFTKEKNSVVDFVLLGKKTFCYNNSAVQFLIKEIFIERVYCNLLEKPKTILDIGSNIGLSVISFRQMYPDVLIKAFEPDRMSFKLLESNILERGYEKVEIYECAISDKEGVLFGNALPSFASVNSVFRDVENVGEDNYKISTLRLAHMLLSSEFDLIKMDIEGQEWSVLNDLIVNGLLHKAKMWAIEFHDTGKHFAEMASIDKAFTTIGYEKLRKGDIIYFCKKNR